MIRGYIKRWLYGNLPVKTKFFPYYGTRVYFPKGSWMFYLACSQGLFEAENTQALIALVEPNTTYFDVGANIGLMSIPILANCPTCKVVAFEPSPETLKYLQRTATNSKFNERWHIKGKAVSNRNGFADFFTKAEEMSLFDGLHDTKRGKDGGKVQVPVTTLDYEWQNLKCPSVSIIKIDVEGAELQVLQGARSCINQERPCILLEWNSVNLTAYDCNPNRLLSFAEEIDYNIYSLPSVNPITNSVSLRLQMINTESFLLAPQ